MLITGTKYYGSHLGPFKTPARESDPRHMPPDYYFDQIDWLTAYQNGKSWDWVELRPQTLCGFAPGTPMSILPAIAVYASISRELGLPLRFPGKPGAYGVDLPGDRVQPHRQCGAVGRHRAALRLRGLQHHQRRLFPLEEPVARIAAAFDMPVGEPQTISLAQHMPDKAGCGAAMTEKYAPQAIRLTPTWSAGRSPTTCSPATGTS